MKKLSLFLLFGCLCAVLFAQTPEKYHRARVNLLGRDIAQLAALGVETDHGMLEKGRSFTTDLSETELAIIRQAGFETEVLISDVSAWYVAQSQQLVAAQRNGDCGGTSGDLFNFPTPANYKPGSMSGYFTYQEMLDILDDMKDKYPNLITSRAPVSDTLVTHEGRPLWYVKVSDNPNANEPEPEVLYTALHHAREPNGLSQMIFFLWHLLENYAQDPQIQYIVNNAELYFIPCVNPDGYLYNEATDPQGGGLFRKNRRANPNGTFGVDLNRNYGHFWGNDDQGSSPNPGSDTYRGPSGFSEPETQMVRDFCLEHGFQIALNYHTFSNLLIYPWGYNDSLATPGFKILGDFLTAENSYKVGTASETVGYAVNGTSDDWMYFATNSLAFTPEVGPGSYGFWPPETAIDYLNKTALYQNIKAALAVLRFGKATDESPARFTEKSLQIPFSLIRYGFQDGPLTVSLTPVSGNIAGISSPQVFTIGQFESANGAFDVFLAPDIVFGQKFSMLLTLDNGQMAWTDTLVKTFGSGLEAAFEEPGNNLSKWNKDKWGITAQTYVSAPASITDSPVGDYKENEFNSMTLKQPIAIPASAVEARARFFAKWSIEEDYDYVQILASSDNANWTPLCGTYTQLGVNSQPFDEPIYEGQQADWVEECLDLSPFLGQNLWLRFDLVSDGFQNFAGFFFDDLVVEYTIPVGTVTLPLAEFTLKQSQPNPARDQALIEWTNAANITGPGKLLVVNLLGQTVAAQLLDLGSQNNHTLDTRNWPTGTYFYQILTERGASATEKLVVAR